MKNLITSKSHLGTRCLLVLAALLGIFAAAGCSSKGLDAAAQRRAYARPNTAQENQLIQDTKNHKLSAQDNKILFDLPVQEKQRLYTQMVEPNRDNVDGPER